MPAFPYVSLMLQFSMFVQKSWFDSGHTAFWALSILRMLPFFANSGAQPTGATREWTGGQKLPGGLGFRLTTPVFDERVGHAVLAGAGLARYFLPLGGVGGSQPGVAGRVQGDLGQQKPVGL